MKKHIISKIVLSVLASALVVAIIIICIFISYNSYIEFNECYNCIGEYFDLCDTKNIFKITDAELQGYYMYDLDVDLSEITSEQELFDEIVSFVCLINEQIVANKESELFTGYGFRIKEAIMDRWCYFMIWVDPYPERNFFDCHTSIFADYSALNLIELNLNSSFVRLDSNDFTVEQLSIIESRKSDYLFSLDIWNL